MERPGCKGVLERLNKQPAMKDHERIFFALCFGLQYVFWPRDVVNLLSETIPHKRCWYYLKKWSALGFYSVGTTLDLGWFDTDKIPARYLEILKEQDSDKLDVALVRLTAAKTIQNHTRAIFGLPRI